MDLPLADVDLATKAGKYVMYVLAVAGGFLIGNILTLILCRLTARVFFRSRMPEPIERALRVIGGVLLAALVAFLLFRFGTGWGLGGTGSGEGEGSGGQAPNQSDKGKEGQPKVEPKPKEPETVISPVVRVRIGKATDYPKTFLFEGEPEGVHLGAAKKRLADLVTSAKGEPRLELRVYQNSTESGHPDVKELIDHAHSLRFSTRVEKLGEQLP